MSECQLEKPPHFQCCCTCKYRMPLKIRIEQGDPMKVGGVSLFPANRYVCAHPVLGVCIWDWPEHSCGCELHTKKEKQ